MPCPPVTIGCAVVVSPGMAGAPDSGTITVIPPGGPTAGGMPLAMTGSICTMVNSVSGAPYTLPIGPLSPSQVRINGQPLVRMGDTIPSGLNPVFGRGRFPVLSRLLVFLPLTTRS